MKRIVIAGVAGGIVLFIWGFVSWMFIPWHQLEKMPGEAQVAQAMRDAEIPSGAYHLPGMVDDPALTDEENDANTEAFNAAHEQGPIATIMYKSGGSSPLGIMSMIVGVVLDIITAGVAAAILTMAAPALGGFVGRVLFVLMLGVYVAVGNNLMDWNWMHYPLKFSLQMAGDTLVASLLLGVTLAIIVNPEAGGADEDGADFEVPAG